MPNLFMLLIDSCEQKLIIALILHMYQHLDKLSFYRPFKDIYLQTVDKYSTNM